MRKREIALYTYIVVLSVLLNHSRGVDNRHKKAQGRVSSQHCNSSLYKVIIKRRISGYRKGGHYFNQRTLNILSVDLCIVKLDGIVKMIGNEPVAEIYLLGLQPLLFLPLLVRLDERGRSRESNFPSTLQFDVN